MPQWFFSVRFVASGAEWTPEARRSWTLAQGAEIVAFAIRICGRRRVMAARATAATLQLQEVCIQPLQEVCIQPLQEVRIELVLLRVGNWTLFQ